MGSAAAVVPKAIMSDVDEAEAMEQGARAQLEVFGLSVSLVIPAALRAIIQMNVPQILADAAAADDEHGRRSSLSADEILSRMPERSPDSSAKNLERLLRILSVKGLFEEEERVEGVRWRQFKLTPMSRALTTRQAGGTMANYALLTSLGQQFTESCKHLGAAVLESKVPFAMAHAGLHQFQYCAANPEYSKQFQAAMTDHSNQLVSLMLAKYDGFKHVQRMADVGGGVGTTIAKIVERYPHIHGINFDLPHVIAHAPPTPGVEHVAGDMFVSIPSGCDAFFLKNIIHDWDDERNIQILKNCYTALPSSGRVIMVDAVLPATTTPSVQSLEDLCAFEADITMMAVSTQGSERDTSEWQTLATQSGFVGVKFIKLDYMYVVEATKP